MVVIGRNEGGRLQACLETLRPMAGRVVYVDSGSTDGSVAMVRAMGVHALELDLRMPFTAARARNAGFERLRDLHPGTEFVQFVDGDCQLAAGWIGSAAAFLRQQPDAAAVCGRLRERYPERSVYNMLCDMEWDVPAGEARAVGGIAMLRSSAFEQVGGFRADLIAGEEPELCVRLRAARWRVWRLGDEMAAHDAEMLRFRQWWRRALRAGYAFAQGAHLHGAPPERHGVRESRSAWLWGFALPVAILAAAAAWSWSLLGLLAIYPLQVARLALRGKRSARENWWRAGFLVLGKFPELAGQIKFRLHRWLGGPSRLIEYK